MRTAIGLQVATARLSCRLCPSVTRNGSPILCMPDYNKLMFPKGLSQSGIQFGSEFQEMRPDARSRTPKSDT
jgi:hypothetical protein